MNARTVTARAPGKVNLSLRVGPLGADGYHPLVTVFQAVDLFEQVTATALPVGSGITVTVGGLGADLVPLDSSNLAYRAAKALADSAGARADVALHLKKGVPVAGGMAGGSADAAATLVACNELWGLNLELPELLELAATLGSDVPFCLMGGTAVGTGRGHLLTPISNEGISHWVFAIQNNGLSTPEVFRKFDDLSSGSNPSFCGYDISLSGPVSFCGFNDLSLGSAESPLNNVLVNDLQPAALALRPKLARTIAVANENGAIGAIVSGSGPTVAALVADESQAKIIGQAWLDQKVADSYVVATGPAPGAQLN